MATQYSCHWGVYYLKLLKTGPSSHTEPSPVLLNTGPHHTQSHSDTWPYSTTNGLQGIVCVCVCPHACARACLSVCR